MAKIEKLNPYFSVREDDFSNQKGEANKRYSNEVLTNKQQIYDLFKPICDGVVSKAIVAQYLAQILTKEREDGVNIKEMILSDLQLKYIVDAIYYATEPANPE